MLFADRFRARRPLSDALYGPVGLYEDAQRGDELVAIKQVSLARAMAALRRNRNVGNPWSEHRVVARLMTLPPHPNVVRFRGEFLHAQDTWCVVMEFCPGGDLWDVLEAAPKNRLPEREAQRRILHMSVSPRVDMPNIQVLVHGCWVGLGHYTSGQYIPTSLVVTLLFEGGYCPSVGGNTPPSPLTSSASRQNRAFGAFCEMGVAKVIDSWGLASSVSPTTIALLDKLLSLTPSQRPTSDELIELFVDCDN
ncbi:hypothetical protein PF003_g29491 [Phytophthora fragariae]|nr:hypothetical protein PF003_g29491 [Phytophthora fragariae]